jgi:hypothetical protein
MGVYDASQQTVEVDEQGHVSTAYTEPSTGLENVPSLGAHAAQPDSAWSWAANHWGPLAILALVLTTWSVFAFTLFQMYGVSRVHDRR